mgnify:FL=1|tara:strand:+ start:539 stop:874 length:336 start_codon:yes stop_codon:yes gene_type:complete
MNTENQETIGVCKWFNNKAGYGFIRVMSKERNGEDVFVHHSALKTNNDQYKYLVQGEYISFKFSRLKTEDNREWQAVDVRGCLGGDLMCETRYKNRQSNLEKKKDNSTLVS